MNVKLPAKRPLLSWVVERAALLLNIFEVGKGGKTAYERCKGKKAK